MTHAPRPPREADLSRVRTIPVATRPNKVRAEAFAAPPGADRSFAAFLRALPDSLKAHDFRAIVDAVVRLLPGAMSDIESARTDSFYGRGISAPSYTRPAEYRGFGVPEVLLSGNHAAIEKWREEEGVRRTQERG